MPSTFAILNVVAGLILLYGVKVALTRKKHGGVQLPPGPKPLPLVGNLRDLPPAGARDWEHWAKHKDLYGPISSVTVLGTTLIIINDADIALELMDKRGSKYSARPVMVFGMEMCGWSNALSSQQYTPRFRAYRSRIHKVIGTPSVLSRFYPLQEVEVHRFLLRVLENPAGLLQHIRSEAGAIILKITYGYNIEPHGADPLVDIADEALAQFSASTVPGAWLVDTIPLLKYMPDWLPGAGFKKTARLWYRTWMKTAEWPLRFVRMQMANDEAEDCFVTEVHDSTKELLSEEEEYVLKWSAASMYAGGADTSVSTMQTFFLAMTLYPEVQAKAREEIDRVVGSQRLPTLDDRPNLPYVEAVVKEAFRWHPIAPMAIPHVSAADDIYNGYLIPKGAMLLPNVWGFTHNPDVYPEPMLFKPERFLGATVPPNPQDYVFGFGRRICPGKLLADSSVWLTVAKSLAAFDIKSGAADAGTSAAQPPKFTPGVISHPHPFTASIEPRTPGHAELIRAVEREHPWPQSSAKALRTINIDEQDIREAY
ncbi:cytochrome protein [Thozetella sp. PMI_491]|nr:cytochrome protein [Thozetella sp. PMI_491]